METLLMLLQMIHHSLNTLTADDKGIFKDVKLAVPLNYLTNLLRSLEMPLINCKIHLELDLD